MGKEYSMRDFEARDEVIRAVLNLLQADMGPADDPHFDASKDYAKEGVAHAARELYYATERLPRGERPVGWNTKPRDGIVPVSLTAQELDAIIAGLHSRAAWARIEHPELLLKLQQERAAFDRHPEKQEAAP